MCIAAVRLFLHYHSIQFNSHSIQVKNHSCNYFSLNKIQFECVFNVFFNLLTLNELKYNSDYKSIKTIKRKRKKKTRFPIPRVTLAWDSLQIDLCGSNSTLYNSKNSSHACYSYVAADSPIVNKDRRSSLHRARYTTMWSPAHPCLQCMHPRRLSRCFFLYFFPNRSKRKQKFKTERDWH